MTAPTDERDGRVSDGTGSSKPPDKEFGAKRGGSIWSTFRRQLFDPQERQSRLTELHQHAGRIDAAEIAYRKLLRWRPASVPALSGLARLLMQQRRFSEAIDVWEQASAIKPDSVNLAFQLARALHRSGQFEPAARQYIRVLTLDPLHEKAVSALEQLSSRLVRSHDPELAIEIGRQLRALTSELGPRQPYRPINRGGRRGATGNAQTIGTNQACRNASARTRCL